MLDYSQSMFDSDSVTAMEDATVAFISQLSADDEAELIKFNEAITVVQPFTTDKKALVAAVDSVFLPAAVTELYRATIKGIDNTATRDPENRKAVVVITDGRNNSFSPNITSDTVIADANAKGIPVFTIGLGVESDWDALEKIASNTGGQFYPSYQMLTHLMNQCKTFFSKSIV